MVRAVFFAAIIALVAIYSRETFAKTLVNPSIAEPAIIKHTKNTDDDNRSAAHLHHRSRRSPSSDEQDDLGDAENFSDVRYSGGGGSAGHQKSSSASTASGDDGVQISVDRRRRPRTRFSRSQISQLESKFLHEQYPSLLERERLAVSLGLTSWQVMIWFKNHRRKVKNQAMPSEATARERITKFSESQISQLENTFLHEQCPSLLERERLAASLGLTSRQVISWFRNRRSRAKNQAMPSEATARGGISRLSESQISQLEGAFDRDNYLSPSEGANLAASLGLTEYQVGKWFEHRRYKKQEQLAATFNPIHMALAFQTLLRSHMLHHVATVLGQSATGIGGSVPPSVASSSASFGLPYSVDDGTSGLGVPTGGPEMFHSHYRQHQFYRHPFHVQADRDVNSSITSAITTVIPLFFPPHPHSRRDSSE